MALVRFAILAIAIAMAFPARFAGWLSSGADGTTSQGAECQTAPLEDDDAPIVASEIVDLDDDDADGQSAVVLAVSPPIPAARPLLCVPHDDGLSASRGVSGSLFRPPCANG
ncbi:MAG TPA: hypothetical protein VF395_04270 [Polyangiaceae bacterium]